MPGGEGWARTAPSAASSPRESPADIEYEDDQILAFKDLYPKAAIHLLIIPKRHIDSLARVDPRTSRCSAVASRPRGCWASGRATRTRVPTHLQLGPEGVRSCFHVHFHFTAGGAEPERPEEEGARGCPWRPRPVRLVPGQICAYFISSIADLALSLARPRFPDLQAVSASLTRDAAFLKSAEDVEAPASVRGAWICWSPLRGAWICWSPLRGAWICWSPLRGAWICWSPLRGAWIC